MGGKEFFDKVPPQNEEAERSLLGSCILDNDVIGSVVQIVKKESFYKTAHQLIFQSIVTLYDGNQPVDLILLREDLKKEGNLEKAGGTEYLVGMAESVPSPANAEHYAKLVQDKYLLRELNRVTLEILRDSYEERENAREILDRSEQKIFSIVEKEDAGEATRLSRVLKDTFERLDNLQDRKGRITGIPTGFFEMDDLTCGLQSSELIVVAGRPSMGKTSFVLNIAEHVAVEEKLPVGIFSLEMAKQQVAQNMLCSRAQVNAHKMRRGYISQDDWATLAEVAGVLSESEIYIDDSSGINVLSLRAKARRLKAQKGIRLLIVDYLQLMESPQAENRQQEITLISRSLKSLARELGTPIIAVSQLNRAVDSREDHRPRMSDLRESGAIEQDADLICFLFREEYYRPSESNRGTAEMIVAKQRNGPTGTVQLAFQAEFMRFRNLSYQPIG